MTRFTCFTLSKLDRTIHFKTIFLMLCMVSLPAQAIADRLPKVRVYNVRRVFHNGEHNAFTNLIRFKDKFYLTFRSCPDGHMVHPTASIIILSSADAKEWKQMHRFRVQKRDTRDPHFLVFKDTLFVYTGTWYSGKTSLKYEDYDLNKHLGYAAWSEEVRSGAAQSCWKERLATISGGPTRLTERRISAAGERRTLRSHRGVKVR